jgi:hypothetical protein
MKRICPDIKNCVFEENERLLKYANKLEFALHNERRKGKKMKDNYEKCVQSCLGILSRKKINSSLIEESKYLIHAILIQDYFLWIIIAQMKVRKIISPRKRQN